MRAAFLPILITALTSSALTAQGFQLPPADLAPGQEYRVLCITQATTDSVSSADISTYNAFVDADCNAEPALAVLGTNWRALASSPASTAPENTMTDPAPAGPTGVPIYRPDGVRVANNYDALWNASNVPLAATPNVNSRGEVTSGYVWSGTGPTGLGTSSRLGDPNVTSIGEVLQSDGRWVFHGGGFPSDAQARLYAMSDVLTVPEPYEHPANLQPGDVYRILIVTDESRNATSSNIAVYNQFVTNEVATNGPLAALGAEWKALASTSAVNARTNTGTNASDLSRPIYLRNGTLIANDYAQLWSGSLLAQPRISTSGANQSGAAWTGSTPSGSQAPGGALGAGAPWAGNLTTTSPFWMQSFQINGVSSFRLYALSSEIVVPLEAQEVPRVGSSSNPNVFLPGVTSKPIIGQTWDPVIDHSQFVPDATLDFVLISPDPTSVPLPGIATGNLLCNLAIWHVSISNFTPGTPFEFALPNSAALVGNAYCVQGGSLNNGATPMHFANALDIVIGTF